MKKIFLNLLLCLFTLTVNAQENSDHSVIKIEIPAKLAIKDKIVIINRSPYNIEEVRVAKLNESGEMESLGTAKLIAPNGTVELASFDNNYLKKLRGKTIFVKAKAVKNFLSNEITYDFKASISEIKHDLYISLSSKGNNDVMNF